MAIKKSDLYSSIWALCNELRGSMDASQYKDYVLSILFLKYISDKFDNTNDFAPLVIIPKGSSFKDIIKLKGKSDIGEKINTQIFSPLVEANQRLARSDFPDFDDPNKLGEGEAMVKKNEVKSNFITSRKDWSIYGGWVNANLSVNVGKLGSTQGWRIEKPEKEYY